MLHQNPGDDVSPAKADSQITKSLVNNLDIVRRFLDNPDYYRQELEFIKLANPRDVEGYVKSEIEQIKREKFFAPLDKLNRILNVIKSAIDSESMQAKIDDYNGKIANFKKDYRGEYHSPDCNPIVILGAWEEFYQFFLSAELIMLDKSRSNQELLNTLLKVFNYSYSEEINYSTIDKIIGKERPDGKHHVEFKKRQTQYPSGSIVDIVTLAILDKSGEVVRKGEVVVSLRT